MEDDSSASSPSHYCRGSDSHQHHAPSVVAGCVRGCTSETALQEWGGKKQLFTQLRLKVISRYVQFCLLMADISSGTEWDFFSSIFQRVC